MRHLLREEGLEDESRSTAPAPAPGTSAARPTSARRPRPGGAASCSRARRGRCDRATSTLRPADRDGPRQPAATCSRSRPTRRRAKVRLLREFDPCLERRPRRPGPVLRRRGRLRGGARHRRGGLPRPARPSIRVSLDDARLAPRHGRAVVARRRSRAAPSTTPTPSSSTDGRRAFVKTRADAPAGEYAAEAAASLARRAGRRPGPGGDRRLAALPRARVDRAGVDRRRGREGSRPRPRRLHTAGRPRSAAPRSLPAPLAPPPLRRPADRLAHAAATPAATGPSSTPSAGCAR